MNELIELWTRCLDERRIHPLIALGAYETLEIGSQGWHEGRHDPWPHIGFILFILREAYREFEDRVGQLKSPRGAKTELIKSAVNAFSGEFTFPTGWTKIVTFLTSIFSPPNNARR